MTCKDFEQTAIRTEGKLPDEALEHAASCPSCSQFLSTLELATAKNMLLSASLDAHCLEAGKFQMRRIRRIQKIWHSTIGIAASLALLCSIFIITNNSKQSKDIPSALITTTEDDDLDMLLTVACEFDNLELEMHLASTIY